VLPRFRYHRPKTLDEALRLLGEVGPGARILAGGTDLLVGLGDGSVTTEDVVDIKAIPGLAEITLEDGVMTIGACVTVNQLLGFEGLPEDFGALGEAAAGLATYQIRNRATVAGNICNASPACDLGPPLLVLDAEVTAVSPAGERTIPVKDFFVGVKKTCCAPQEIVTGIRVPAGGGTMSVFHKHKRIKGHDLSLVNGAALRTGEGGLRLAIGAAAPTPLLISGLESCHPSDGREVAERVMASIVPIDDVRSSSVYRRAMTEFMVDRLLERLGWGCGKERS
jgi:CO/xanthine dehydrogenase FAD-binding subunit